VVLLFNTTLVVLSLFFICNQRLQDTTNSYTCCISSTTGDAPVVHMQYMLVYTCSICCISQPACCGGDMLHSICCTTAAFHNTTYIFILFCQLAGTSKRWYTFCGHQKKYCSSLDKPSGGGTPPDISTQHSILKRQPLNWCTRIHNPNKNTFFSFASFSSHKQPKVAVNKN